MNKVMSRDELLELREWGENLSLIDSHLSLLDQIESNKLYKNKEITVADYHVTKDKLDRSVELLKEIFEQSCKNPCRYCSVTGTKGHKTDCMYGEIELFLKEVKV